jgi:FkbM family methyltransferase
MSVVGQLRELVRRTGFDVVRYPYGQLQTWARVLKLFDIGLVFDVGANTGQFAKHLRGVGYRGKIMSFEPLKSAYCQLAAYAARDPQWEVRNCAIGSADGSIDINIAGNSYSSSILDMLPAHRAAAPASKYVGKEQVPLRKLDTVLEELATPIERAFLKIDTQGYERHVLDGAERSLACIDTIQLEMSLVPLYDGEALFTDAYQRLFDAGYRPVSIMECFANQETGQLLQVDGIFHRYGM